MAITSYLTKSKFTHYLECPTKLYYKNHGEEYATLQDEDYFLQALAEGGIQVGELAKLYYPGGVEIPYSRDKSVSIEQTGELLQQEETIIYEAAIQHGFTYALVDILVKKGNEIRLIEVKSKSWDAEEGFYLQNGSIRSRWHKYLYDVAFQTLVMQKAYSEFNVRPCLILIDKDTPTSVSGLHQYFKIVENEEGRSEVRLTGNRDEIDLGDPVMTSINVSDEVALIFKGEAREAESKLERKDFDAWIAGLCESTTKDEKYPVTLGAKCRNCEHRVKADVETGAVEEVIEAKYNAALNRGVSANGKRSWQNSMMYMNKVLTDYEIP